jgi:HD-GYP domain-containing protein (c-di-GMP phosphodiesterase class II)/signal transduction histidine kinase
LSRKGGRTGSRCPLGGLTITDGKGRSPHSFLLRVVFVIVPVSAAVLVSLGLRLGALPLCLLSGCVGLVTFVAALMWGRMGRRIAALQAELESTLSDKEAKYENIVRLYEASQATSQEAEPGGIMDMVAEDARKLVGCESASVAIFIEKGLLASVTKGISNEFKRNLRWRVREGGMTDWVLTKGEPLLIIDAYRDPRSRNSSAVRIGKQRSIMAVPLSVKDEVFGIMYAGDTRPDRFTRHDLMLLVILANHAAASIKQARLRRELAKKLEELEIAHKELIGADRLKAEFISTVTSQMRVPLDAIRTYSQTVLQRMDDASFRLKKKFLGAVVEESGKLLNTINGVIDLSRMEFGEGDLRKEEVEIPGILNDVCSLLDPLCMDKDVEVVLEAGDGTCRARLDRDMIFLMFRNLMEASITLARESSSITVVTEEDENFLKTKISITPSPKTLEMENVLQAVSGKEVVPSETGSLGLTLQVAKNIVFRHGGRIWAETHEPSRWNLVVLFGKESKTIMPSDLMLEIMASRPELRRMLALVADMISKVMDVAGCQLLLEDSTTGTLLPGAGVGLDGGKDRVVPVSRGQGLSGRVFDKGSPIVLNSHKDAADLDIGETLTFEKIPCASVPIKLKGRVVGVVTVSDKNGRADFFDDDELGLLAALGDRVGVALERATSYESARDQFVSAMVAMKTVMEARRAPFGKAHEHMDLVTEVGRALGLEEDQVRQLQYVSGIYDVGMVKVGEGIIRRRGGLRAGEYENVKRHPEAGVNIVGPIEFLEQVKEIILHHHEHYDGGGYPGGLKGDSIPIGARILAVVDAYSSMLNDRPYRSAMTVEEAIEELRRCSGSQFDPGIVEKLVAVLRQGEKAPQLREGV